MNKHYERFLDKTIFYTESDFIKMYGQNYRIFLNHDLLIKDENVFNRYKLEEPTLTSSIQGNETTISKTLLHDLLNNEGMYQYLFQNMDNDFGNVVRISLFKEDNKVDSIIISRAVLSDLLLALPKEELSEKEQMRIALITNVSTLNALRIAYRDDLHFAILEDEAISIPSITLFNVLTMSNQKYQNFLNSSETELLIDGKYQKYNTRVVAYMIVSFMERERILAKYLIPDTVYQRFMDLKDYKSIDFESINKNEKSNDYNQDGVSISELVELSDEINTYLNEDIKSTFNPLEIAITKYLKLLNIVEYNQEYYASNATSSTLDANKVKYLDLENNVILPSDIIAIMCYIFKSLNIKYTLDFNKISFKYGEYVLDLDLSNKSLLHDISATKMNDAITSIRCINANKVTKDKFNELLSKINYRYIVEKKKKDDFLSSLAEYKKYHMKYNLSRKMRLEMYFKLISSTSLMGTDAIYYQYKLFKNFFFKEDGIFINTISSSINTIRDYEYVPVIVISVLNGNDYTHFVVDVNSKDIISNVTTLELRELFDDNSLAYLDIDATDIPGIKRSKAYVR